MATRTAPPPIRPRPFLVTDDQMLLDDVIRIAATVGVEFDVAPDPALARRGYPEAPLVLIGEDVLAACVAARLPRRPGVVLVGRRPGASPPFALAEALGAESIAVLPVAEPWLADRIADVSFAGAGDVFGGAGSVFGGADDVFGGAGLGEVDPGDAPGWGGVADSDGFPGSAGPFDAVGGGPRGSFDAGGAGGQGGSAGAAGGRGARVIAVLGGRGGAGASVFAAGLAVTAGRAGLRTLLVDADPLGGGIDLVLGWEAVDGLRWPELLHTSGTVSPPALVEALPNRDTLAAVSWGREGPMHAPIEAMAATLDAGRRGRDLIVVDLPRFLDDPAVLALEAADRVYLVVPAELRASVAAGKVADAAKVHTGALEVVVRLPSPGRLTAAEVVQSLRLPLAGELRSEQRIPQHLERGTPPAGSGRGPLAAMCRRLLADLDLTGRGRAA